MKILVVAPTPFFSDRGTHIRILEEALALEKIGHEITIATYHIGRNIDWEVKNKIDVRRISRLLFWYRKLEAGPDWQKIILDLLLIRKVFFLARTQKPDIIHGHLHEGALIGWLVKKILFWRKIKLVADFHGSLTKEMISHGYLRAGSLNKFFSWLEKIIDNLGDCAITSSWENTGEIKKFRKDNKAATVLDGVNLDYYRKFSSKEASKKELELPGDRTIVTYTGALIANKGIDYLLPAIPLALAQNEQLFFILAGFPVAEAEKFVKAEKLEKNVRIIHPLNYFDLPEILNASDIAIDPKDRSVSQASGKILQYMGAGLPIICFDKSNNRRYLDKGAYYVSEFSIAGLAKGIIELSGNLEKTREMGQKNKERAQNFSWDHSAEKLDQIYKNLIKK
ncbi:MAG: glycosyltransferase family 1 protein [Candidatus Moranbacteria bacterium CG06_land_8_20_14_3_00_40_12]|nr:MAG: glycoside hydrolase [Candidatus Moranbacteria bacterium CG23_combo_of_CG06-09_8_20_14_all_40_16]PIU81081.1 MAG: glycosyltransferase family 1 protein [Candidatus Moranbacteria bacterium CG06_land_8_20_14_3_00_40_12]